MRRPAVSVLACALVLLLAALATVASLDAPARAQDADPATVVPVPYDEGTGEVSSEYLSNGIIERAAPDHVLELVRVTIQPGGRIEEAQLPGGALVYVERGAVEVATSEESELLRPEGGAAPAPQDGGCADGCELGSGASVVLPYETGYAVANRGDEPAVLYVSALTRVGASEAEGGISPLWCDRGCRTMAEPTTSMPQAAEAMATPIS